MKLRGLTPMLRVPDMAASIAFYGDTLGFSCVAGGSDAGWASLRRDDIEIMLACQDARESDRGPAADVSPAHACSLYLRTDDVDAWWTRLKDIARLCYPVENFWYGMREFGIYDNNGFLLQFGQALPDGATPDCKE